MAVEGADPALVVTDEQAAQDQEVVGSANAGAEEVGDGLAINSVQEPSLEPLAKELQKSVMTTAKSQDDDPIAAAAGESDRGLSSAYTPLGTETNQ